MAGAATATPAWMQRTGRAMDLDMVFKSDLIRVRQETTRGCSPSGHALAELPAKMERSPASNVEETGEVDCSRNLAFRTRTSAARRSGGLRRSGFSERRLSGLSDMSISLSQCLDAGPLRASSHALDAGPHMQTGDSNRADDSSYLDSSNISGKALVTGGQSGVGEGTDRAGDSCLRLASLSDVSISLSQCLENAATAAVAPGAGAVCLPVREKAIHINADAPQAPVQIAQIAHIVPGQPAAVQGHIAQVQVKGGVTNWAGRVLTLPHPGPDPAPKPEVGSASAKAAEPGLGIEGPYGPNNKMGASAEDGEGDDEFEGKEVIMIRGKYKGTPAFIQRKVNKKYRVQVEGVPWGLEFYPNMFKLP